jgi:hypothetical protein
MSTPIDQPARGCGSKYAEGTRETLAFANRTAKRRRARDLAKTSRKKNR